MFKPLGEKIETELNSYIKLLLTEPLKANLQTLRPHLPHDHWKLLIVAQAECLKSVSKNKSSIPRLFNVNIDINDITIMSINDTQALRLDENKALYLQGIWDQVTVNLERDGIAPSAVSNEERSKLIMFYGLVDAVILSFSGILVPLKKSNILGFSKNDTGETMHFNYWFSRFWSQQSEFGNMVLDSKILKSAQQQGKTVTKYLSENRDVLHDSVSFYIDKLLSINNRFINKVPPAAKPLLEELRTRLHILNYCHLRAIEDVFLKPKSRSSNLYASALPCKITNEDLKNVGISLEEVKKLLHWSDAQSETERILIFDSINYQLGNISIAHGMVHYSADILRQLGSVLGNWFETDYIMRYMESEVDSSRYKIHPGFKANQKETSKYDIDFVIEDIIKKKVYFCQAKFRIKTTFPTLKSALLEFFYGDQIQKGLGQLKALETVLFDERVRHKLNTIPLLQKKSDDWIRENTSLILIHNIENFDFLEYDGISLYEWNSIRNLMHGSINQRDAEGNTVRQLSTRSLCLADVKGNIISLTKQLSDSTHDYRYKPSYQWSIIQRARVQFSAQQNWRLIKRNLFSKQIRISIPLI